MSFFNYDHEIYSSIILENIEGAQGKLNISDYNENNKTIYDIVEHIPSIQDDSQANSINKLSENSSLFLFEGEENPVERNADNLEIFEKKDEPKDTLEIKKKENYIFFFLLANDHEPTPFSEKLDTKIGAVIDKYIKNLDEKEEIRNTFYYKDKKIDDMNKTIRELKIEHLGFLHSKSN